MTAANSEQTLDPDDWAEIRTTFHEAVDQCLDAMQNVRQKPVWQPVPESLKPRFRESLPLSEQPISDVFSLFQQTIQPYGTGNTHPRFFGWVHGSGSAAGVLGEMLAAFMNCNAGGRDHVAIYVERQILDWCKEIFSFPRSSSGILTSGTSLGTLIALTAARTAKSAVDVQKLGLHSLPKPLVGYASTEAHSCAAKTFDLLGLGQDALRRVPVNSDYQMDLGKLAEMIAADKANGFEPFVVIASAGTVNTGAIDDLAGIAEICKEQSLWMHVDAAFGGLAILTPEFREQLAPIAQADSVAFDFHKWLHVPYDAGCVLIKDEAAHRKSFSARREYLISQPRGLAGGDFWPCDYSPELSRGFRALKIWFTLKTYGMTKLAALISQNCRQAQYLSAAIQRVPELQLLAPVTLNIACFRFWKTNLAEAELDTLNTDIVAELQLQGIAAPSTTKINGKTAIRVALTNHRTLLEDLDILTEAVCRLGHAGNTQ
ncbi:MAG: pyridoxal phosphate-dependent decarboxylase family protein [Janthinobacterium lividum]